MAGCRALLIQSAHPEVVDGFWQHSNLMNDPIGRISRTGEYVAVTSFGSMPEVKRMVAMVKKVHEKVVGVSSRGIKYSANQPNLNAWVHYALVQSFLKAYQLYGDAELSTEDANRFVKEQTKLAKLMNIDELITSEAELNHWMHHHPQLGTTEATMNVIKFLKKPPIKPSMMLGYNLIFDAALDSIHPNIRSHLKLKKKLLGHVKGKLFTKCLRFSMGYSPALKQAYERINVPPPKNRWFVDD